MPTTQQPATAVYAVPMVREVIITETTAVLVSTNVPPGDKVFVQTVSKLAAEKVKTTEHVFTPTRKRVDWLSLYTHMSPIYRVDTPGLGTITLVASAAEVLRLDNLSGFILGSACTRKDDGNYDVTLTLRRSDAKAVLGYEPHASEWQAPRLSPEAYADVSDTSRPIVVAAE